jgi:hypothetical protein
MGSTQIVLVVAAIVVAVVCFAAGFLYGRSNLKARIEQALEDGHGGLDFREFAIRQQLDEAVAEVARLRPLAEEYGRVQDRLKREQAQYDQMKTEFDATLKAGTAGASGPGESATVPQEAAPVSADEAIQKLLKSLEQTVQEPDEQPLAPIEPPRAIEKQPPAVAPSVAAAPVVAPRVEPAPASSLPATPRVQPPAPRVPRPAASNPPKPAGLSKPEPKAPQKTETTGPAVDEWQEFARSLADLTRRNQ